MPWEGLHIMHVPLAIGGTQLFAVLAALIALIPL